MTEFWCEHAWLDGHVERGVLVRCAAPAGGLITKVSIVDAMPGGAHRLRGLVLPGMANAHSHAFHRALRGRTHTGAGSFWSWRETMYALADRLDPDAYRRLATAVYAELVLAGWTCVGEFHYLHHAAGGTRYAEPNAMAAALRQAAADAGIRLTLLDACYLAGGIGAPPTGVQLRFSDGTVEAWAARFAELVEWVETAEPAGAAGAAGGPGLRVGAAIHSVRAVPAKALPDVVAAAGTAQPLHVHLSEQPAENEACLAGYGRTPTQLLHEAGALAPRTTAVHATHVDPADIALLGSAAVTVCPCPTTEADLADGIGPMRRLADAGCAVALGSDQHVVTDPFAEARGLEAGERLVSRRRGRFSPAALLRALTSDGHAALGWPGGGRITVGAPCDLVAVRLDSPRTAGCEPAQAVLAASASDVDTVIVNGRVVAAGGEHRALGDVGALLGKAIAAVWQC